MLSLFQVKAKMEELKKVYDEKLEQKEDLKRKADYTEMMLERAAKLVEGLAKERVRWEETVQVRKEIHKIERCFIKESLKFI